MIYKGKIFIAYSLDRDLYLGGRGYDFTTDNNIIDPTISLLLVEVAIEVAKI